MEPFSFSSWLNDHRGEIKQKKSLSMFGDNFETEVRGYNFCKNKEVFIKAQIIGAYHSDWVNPGLGAIYSQQTKLCIPTEVPVFGPLIWLAYGRGFLAYYFHLQNQPKLYFCSFPLGLKQLLHCSIPLLIFPKSEALVWCKYYSSVFSFFMYLSSIHGPSLIWVCKHTFFLSPFINIKWKQGKLDTNQRAWAALKHSTSQFSQTQSSLGVKWSCQHLISVLYAWCLQNISSPELLGVTLQRIQYSWQQSDRVWECQEEHRGSKKWERWSPACSIFNVNEINFSTSTGSWQGPGFMRRKCLFQEQKQEAYRCKTESGRRQKE